MHYFNDKPCFLMLISALNTPRLSKIHPMVKEYVGREGTIFLIACLGGTSVGGGSILIGVHIIC